MLLLLNWKLCKLKSLLFQLSLLLIICVVSVAGLTACSQAEAYQTTGPVSSAPGQITAVQSSNNQPPVIENLAADALEVKKATQVALHCTAVDPDGDVLKYTWEATGGNIIGEGAAVTWVAPNNYADYTLKVIVEDGRGGAISREITIKVSCLC